MSYSKIVVAISDVLEKEYLHDAGVAIPATDVIAGEIIGAQHRMPDYLRAPMYVMTFGFDMLGLLRGGRRFQNLDHDRRLVCIDAWRNSRLGVLRSFVRFYESLFLLIALQEDDR